MVLSPLSKYSNLISICCKVLWIRKLAFFPLLLIFGMIEIRDFWTTACSSTAHHPTRLWAPIFGGRGRRKQLPSVSFCKDRRPQCGPVRFHHCCAAPRAVRLGHWIRPLARGWMLKQQHGLWLQILLPAWVFQCQVCPVWQSVFCPEKLTAVWFRESEHLQLHDFRWPQLPVTGCIMQECGCLCSLMPWSPYLKQQALEEVSNVCGCGHLYFSEGRRFP